MMATYDLVCPFLTEDPVYALGVELGLLCAKMRGRCRRIRDYFSRQNQEQILLLANRLGWTVKRISAHDDYWFWCHLERQKPRHL